MTQSLRFVVVEDDPTAANIIRMLLEREGYRVHVCMDALAAVDVVDRQRPDVVLIDIMMPGMDGIELCRRLGSIHSLRDCKRVVVTGKAYEADRARALGVGAAGVITKPIDPKTFVADVLKHANDETVLSYWGVRSGMPVPGPNATRYGGHTSCVSLTLPGEQRLIFDAGTGITALADSLAVEATPPISARLLISHPQWDRIDGLPHFLPAFERGNELEILGPMQGDISIRQSVGTLFDPIHSEVGLRDLAARIFFNDLHESTYQLGSCQVRTLLLDHAGNSLAYRVKYKGLTVCVVPDARLPTPGSIGYNAEAEARLIDFLSQADIALMDSSYGDQRVPGRPARGAAIIPRLVEVAYAAKVKELQFYRHGPGEDDDAIDAKVTMAREYLQCLGSPMICNAPAAGTHRVFGRSFSTNRFDLRRVA